MHTPEVIEAVDTRLVGYCDLDGQAAFKLAMYSSGDHRYLYCGSLYRPGWFVLDVTDPRAPKMANFIAGPADTWTIQVQIADGILIAGLEKPTAGWGYREDAPFEDGAYVWDLRENPIEPTLLSHYRTGGRGTHRNFYAGGDLAVLTANLEDAGYKGRLPVFLDVSDPANPYERSRWWWPGQHLDAGEVPEYGAYLHGPAYVQGSRAYLGYGQVGLVVLDVSDIDRPELVSRVSFGDLGAERPGCHSAVPIVGRNLIVVNSEAHQDHEGDIDQLNYTFVVQENGDEYTVISSFPMPKPIDGLGYRNYFEKGGRFGPHNQHHHQGQPVLAENGTTIYMTYFNAGLRIFDISDPFTPEEIACFVPDDPPLRRGPKPDRLVTQFEDVLVDDRGYIYCSDKNRGIFVIEHLSG